MLAAVSLTYRIFFTLISLGIIGWSFRKAWLRGERGWLHWALGVVVVLPLLVFLGFYVFAGYGG